MATVNPEAGRGREVFSARTGLIISTNLEEAHELEFQLTTLLGLRVMVTGTAGEAEKALKSENVDIILLDVQRDHTSPFAICKVVKSDEHWMHIPVVALLGAGDQQNRYNALNFGADDFITRPFDYSEVYSRIRSQLRLRELHLQLIENERQRVLIEMAGAAAHELAQPVTGAMGLIEIILEKKGLEQKVSVDQDLHLLYDCLKRAADVIHKIQKVRKYATTPYAGATQIIDIHKASQNE